VNTKNKNNKSRKDKKKSIDANINVRNAELKQEIRKAVLSSKSTRDGRFDNISDFVVAACWKYLKS
jgi:hypothetical protein